MLPKQQYATQTQGNSVKLDTVASSVDELGLLSVPGNVPLEAALGHPRLTFPSSPDS